MTRGRKTSEETRAKVVDIKMKNLDLSSHQIEDMLKWTEWEVSNDTICDIINNLPQLATNTLEWTKQIQRLDSIIWGIERITKKLVAKLENEEKITVNDVKQLNDIAKTNWERKRLLEGESTGNNKIEFVIKQ